MPKPIYLVVAESSAFGVRDGLRLFALCDDGLIWSCAPADKDRRWKQWDEQIPAEIK